MTRLFDPITLRGLTVRNRIWLSPMCQYSCDARDGMPSEWHLVHLGARAQGGFGLVMTEAAAVVPEGRISPQDAGLWNDAQRDAWARIVEFGHTQGAAMAVQLAHAGRKASTYRPFEGEPVGSVPEGDGGWETVAPSAVPFDGYSTPRELSVDEIADVVRAFADAARRADEAGFDVVEVHAAHGYLLHEFLSPLSNRRGAAHPRGGGVVVPAGGAPLRLCRRRDRGVGAPHCGAGGVPADGGGVGGVVRRRSRLHRGVGQLGDVDDVRGRPVSPHPGTRRPARPGAHAAVGRCLCGRARPHRGVRGVAVRAPLPAASLTGELGAGAALSLLASGLRGRHIRPVEVTDPAN